MSHLLYREDMDAVRERLTTWWTGGDIGRPAIQMYIPCESPRDVGPAPEVPAGVEAPNYTVKSFDFRARSGPYWAAHGDCLAEGVPTVCPDLAPNCLALYLGCRGVEGPGTVWCEPFIDTPETARFEADLENNFYWDFTVRLTREYAKDNDKFLQQFPDLIEGLDTLAAMRETQTLLMDLVDRPEWVADALGQITREYFRCYDRLYEMMKDETGGSIFWAWAPGRMSKLQCDFSAMISTEMFDTFMMPVLREMTGKLDHSMYHFDGPGALQHHRSLMSLPDLDMLQWTPGSGNVPKVHDRHWFDLYHKTIDAGKKVFVMAMPREKVEEFKQEFGRDFRHFMFRCGASSRAEAEEFIRACEV